MIAVVISEECKKTMADFGLSRSDVIEPVRNRTRGSLVGASDKGVCREPLLRAIRWFTETRSVYLDGAVTRKRVERTPSGNRLHLDEVTVNLALELRNQLPAGLISADMQMEEIVAIIAHSFGYDFMLPGFQRRTTYVRHASLSLAAAPSAAAIGTPEFFSLELGPKDSLVLSGLFAPGGRTVQDLWIFSLRRYRAWFDDTLGGTRARA